MLGRPVTSAGQRNATPMGVAFCVSCSPVQRKSSIEFPDRWHPKPTCQPTALGCSIRLAYQAADASHPGNRAERARRRARKFRRTGFISSSKATRGGNSHRKGITRGKHRPHRIDSANRTRRGTPERFHPRGRQGSSGAILPGMVAELKAKLLTALCRMSSRVSRSQAREFLFRGTGGRQRKFSSRPEARLKLQNAMHQTAHCQEVHA
jgi:hypothetical protein